MHYLVFQEMKTRARRWSPDIRQIDLDVNRTYRNHIMFRRRFDVKWVADIFTFHNFGSSNFIINVNKVWAVSLNYNVLDSILPLLISCLCYSVNWNKRCFYLQAAGFVSYTGSVLDVQHRDWLLPGHEPDCCSPAHVLQWRSMFFLSGAVICWF